MFPCQKIFARSSSATLCPALGDICLPLFLLRYTTGMCQGVLKTTTQVNRQVGNSTHDIPRYPKKSLPDSHQNLHGSLRPSSLSLCKMPSPYDYPICPPPQKICENAHQVTRLVFFGSSFAIQPTPCTDFYD